jgi:hypothetical protein
MSLFTRFLKERQYLKNGSQSSPQKGTFRAFVLGCEERRLSLSRPAAASGPSMLI